MEVKRAWGVQTNPYYDSEKANNGGGYSQPAGGAIVNVNGRNIIVLIDDTSCGDFGNRIFIDVDDGVRQWKVYYCTMDDCGDDDETLNAIRNSIERTLQCDARELVKAAYAAMLEKI